MEVTVDLKSRNMMLDVSAKILIAWEIHPGLLPMKLLHQRGFLHGIHFIASYATPLVHAFVHRKMPLEGRPLLL